MSEKKVADKVRIYKELCKGVEGCGICLNVCRRKLFKPAPKLNSKGYRPPEMSDTESCALCEDCMIFCPDLAIAVAEKERKKSVKK